MNKDFSGLSKLQCFGQNACGGGCTPCFPCAPCPPACIVSKTVTRVVNSVPAPAPAPLPTAEYGYVFNDGLQTVAAAAGVRFSTNGVLSAGVTHTAGGNAVVLADAGTYAVWFTVMGTAANQFILYLNDTSVPGTFYGTETGAAGSAVRTLTTALPSLRPLPAARSRSSIPRRDGDARHGSRGRRPQRQRFHDGRQIGVKRFRLSVWTPFPCLRHNF